MEAVIMNPIVWFLLIVVISFILMAWSDAEPKKRKKRKRRKMRK